MTALLLKDLRLLRPWWWMIVPGHVLFGANGIISPETFFALNVALALTYTVGLVIVEWKQEGDRFVGSLPVSRAAMVRARYAGALGAAALGTALYALYGRVLLGLGTERLLARWPPEPGWESVAGLAAFFLTAWLLAVAWLPFYYRAGLGRGTWLFVAVAALVLVGATLVARSWRWWSALPADGPGPIFTFAVTVAIAASLGWASLRLSIRFFEGRDL